MKKSAIFSLILSAVLCAGSFAGCGKKKDSSSSDDVKNSSVTETTQSAGTDEVKDSSVTDTTQAAGTGELIYPDEGSQEYELGAYRISDKGIKLYYEDAEYPKELVSALESYFLSFQNGDYNEYKNYIFPSYIDTMEKKLQEDYGYGLEQSFQMQCDNLNVNMGGSFEITRIKVEPPLEIESEEVGADEFLDNLNEFFGNDYKASVKADSDNLRYMTFSVMARDTDGNESLLVSSFYILFAEKDGRYYTFG